MKILVLNYEYPPLGGGGGPVSKSLCELYARRGHYVEVVTMGFKGLPKKELQNGVLITRVPSFRKSKAICSTFEMLSYVISAFPVVISKLRRGNYNVIHSHFVIPTGLLAYLATRFYKVPLINTAHGSDVPGFNTDRFKFEHKFTYPLLRLIIRNTNALVAPSNYLRGLILRLGNFKVIHIPNGINIPKLKVQNKKHRILMTGRLLPRKGFQCVLKALKEIKSDYEIHIAGDGPFRNELENIAKAIDSKVIFHGWLKNNSPELKELYETSSIFCLPSERENASISILEAMCAGMAIITSDSTGCAETIKNAGILVPAMNVNKIKEALCSLIFSEEQIKNYGKMARSRVENNFSLKIIGDRYIKLFENIKKADNDLLW